MTTDAGRRQVMSVPAHHTGNMGGDPTAQDVLAFFIQDIDRNTPAAREIFQPLHKAFAAILVKR
jgi:hypothetical protein